MMVLVTVQPGATVATGGGTAVRPPDQSARHRLWTDARLHGIVSERDVVRELGRRGPACLTDRVESLMTAKVTTCARTDTAHDVLTRMTEGRLGNTLPVVENGQMIGLISIGDVVKARLSELSMEKDALEGMIKVASERAELLSCCPCAHVKRLLLPWGAPVSNEETPCASGLYPGTFDPITLGHIDIIQRALIHGGQARYRRGDQPRQDTAYSVWKSASPWSRKNVAKSRPASAAGSSSIRSDNLLIDCARDVGAGIIVHRLHHPSRISVRIPDGRHEPRDGCLRSRPGVPDG